VIVKDAFDISLSQKIGEISSYDLNYTFEFELKVTQTHSDCAQIIQVGATADFEFNGDGSLVVLFDCGSFLEYSFHGSTFVDSTHVWTNDWNKIEMKQWTNGDSRCSQSLTVNGQVLSNKSLSCPTPLKGTQNIFAAGSYSSQSEFEKGQIRNFKFTTSE